ncbi:MAG: DUF4388 domain-containing protein [Planctomycetota bacterium]|nr:DUF4388 domain-containing protein [Planctomycetota bacterium]
MGFKGDLRNIGLSDVFQNISANRLGGTLRIYDEKDERYVFFSQGEATMASRGKNGGSLVDTLLKDGKISERDHDRIAKRQAKSPKSLSELLAEMKVMKPDDFRSFARHFLEEEVYEIFSWTSALFEFTEGEPPPEIFDPAQKALILSIPATGIIMEAARRLDEWEKIGKRIPTFRAVVVPTSPIQAGTDIPGGEVGRAVMESADGRRSVQWLIDHLPHTKFEICKAVADLEEAGMLRTLSEFERVRLAETFASAGQTDEALEILRLSLEVDRNDHDMRRKYASLLEQLGKLEEAASEVKILAHMLLEAGHREGAVGAYQWAASLSPSDTVALEKLYGLRKEIGGGAGADEAGRELAQLYRKVGLKEKARDLYLELVEASDDDPDLDELLAKTYLELGETRSAASRYRSAARLHLGRRNYDEAAEIYEQILKIDPENPEAQKIIIEIREGRIALRKQRLRRAAGLFVAIAGGLVLGGVLVYEGFARYAFHLAHKDEITLLQNGNVMGAIDRYKEVSSRYPYSLSGAEARGIIARLAGWQIGLSKSPDEITQLLELDLPEEIRVRGEGRREYLEIHLQLASYERMRDDERRGVQENIAAIREVGAAGPILQIHREIRGRTWSPEINIALLKALEGINHKQTILPILIIWLDEIDQDYGGPGPQADNDRKEIRETLIRLTGRKDASTKPEALTAGYWRSALEGED